MSFSPPPSDYSVIFLGDIFGVVDGVLSGTGSQIMGTMYYVLNSAILAVGGVVCMYVVLVGTMNTAHEGKMLGQKWSSMWIPLRCTIGLALMMPKASGYCLMQVFVMWIVLQGVGAADKIWSTALEYLNRGGVIVQAQMNPMSSLKAGNNTVAETAYFMLNGAACMASLQQMLEDTHAYYQDDSSGSSICSTASDSKSTLYNFCSSTVPNFMNSIDFVGYQQDNYSYNSPATSLDETATLCSTSSSTKQVSSTTKLTMNFPNFDSSTNSFYSKLNGICGAVSWTPLSLSNYGHCCDSSTKKVMGMTVSSGCTQGTWVSNVDDLTTSDIYSSQISVPTALQQMFINLSQLGQDMVNNDPQIGTTSTDSSQWFNDWAVQQYGVPFLSEGNICPSQNKNCPYWNGIDNSNGDLMTMMFTGTEYQTAIAAFNGVLMATSNLINEGNSHYNQNSSRDFIKNAELNGWINAGSYFFNIVSLNGSAGGQDAVGGSNQSVAGKLSLSGKFLPNYINGAFNSTGTCYGSSSSVQSFSTTLCQIYQDSTSTYSSSTPSGNPSSPLFYLLYGTNNPSSSVISAPVVDGTTTPVTGSASATVHGYATNASVLTLPGQPGLVPAATLKDMNFNFNMAMDPPTFGPMGNTNFGCGRPSAWVGCLMNAIGYIIYEIFTYSFFYWFIQIAVTLANTALQFFLQFPLRYIGFIFIQEVAIIQDASANPVVALAEMGVSYINFAMDLWIELIGIAIFCALVPVFGIVIFAIMALCLPLLTSWLGIMLSIGFSTAYYIPFLPYMMFTFGAIAWLMVVIEAMTAAPIVALGITHPEGHEAFGKGEAAINILLNIFLRPSMMIIGFISAIAMTYVSVWILNMGFNNVDTFIQGSDPGNMNVTLSQPAPSAIPKYSATNSYYANGYTSWAGIYGLFFSILMYTTLYLTVTQKAFELIFILPDRVLRWMGAAPEDTGRAAAQWGEDAKGKIDKAGDETGKAGAQMGKQMESWGKEAMSAMGQQGGGDVTAKQGTDGKSGPDGAAGAEGGAAGGEAAIAGEAAMVAGG